MTATAKKVTTTNTRGEWVRLLPLMFQGHALYVRACLPGQDADNQDPKVRRVGSIIIPPAMGAQTVWFEVIGCGENVGKETSKAYALKYRREQILQAIERGQSRQQAISSARQPTGIEPDSIIGEIVMIALPYPLVDQRVVSSPYNPTFEAFVEETLPIAKVDRRQLSEEERKLIGWD